VTASHNGGRGLPLRSWRIRYAHGIGSIGGTHTILLHTVSAP